MSRSKKTTGKVFMAVAKGQDSNKGANSNKVIGIGTVQIIAINPNKATMERVLGFSPEEEPVYFGVKEDASGNKIANARVNIWVKGLAEDNNGVEFVAPINFFLRKQKFISKTGLVQVINAYGETTWITEEELASKTLPEGKEFFHTKGMRAAYMGEADLTDFIKAYLNIPQRTYTNKDGQRVEIKNPANAEVQLDGIAGYFSGNFNEIKQVLGYQPENKVKVPFGIRTVDDKEYQANYNMFFKNKQTTFDRLETALSNYTPEGSRFEVSPVRYYTQTPTNYTQGTTEQPAAGNFWD